MGTALVGANIGIALLICAIVFMVIAWVCHRRIRGVTGDTLGASTEITEVVLLAAGASVLASAL